jgi:hypothetical protein
MRALARVGDRMAAMGDALNCDSVDAALEQIGRTHGHVPDRFRLLADHAPEAFLGYMGLREFVFRAPPEEDLAIWAKEFVPFRSISKPAIFEVPATICAMRCAPV